jgi:hypothetical protein
MVTRDPRTTLGEKIRQARMCCREAVQNVTERGRDLFKGDWKVLLIRRDPESGKYMTETLCCDEASVSQVG